MCDLCSEQNVGECGMGDLEDSVESRCSWWRSPIAVQNGSSGRVLQLRPPHRTTLHTTTTRRPVSPASTLLMPSVQYQAVTPQKLPFRFARTWGTSLGLWGVGAGAMVLYMLSVTPLVKREFLSKVPVIGDYWADKTPASDKPF